MKLILASNNAHKLREFKQILSPLGIEIIPQSEAGCHFEVDETGTTFEENAYLKAVAVTEKTGLPAVADDSGLEVDALGGAPGIYSARYTGNHEDTDEDRLNLVLKNLETIRSGAHGSFPASAAPSPTETESTPGESARAPFRTMQPGKTALAMTPFSARRAMTAPWRS